MEYKQFKKIMKDYKKLDKQFSKLHKLGFDFYEGKYPIQHHTDTIFTDFINTIYGEEGVDWVSWFIYESNWGKKDWSEAPTYSKNEKGETVILHEAGEKRYGAYDENGNPICYSLKSLWECLESLNKTKD